VVLQPAWGGEYRDEGVRELEILVAELLAVEVVDELPERLFSFCRRSCGWRCGGAPRAHSVSGGNRCTVRVHA